MTTQEMLALCERATAYYVVATQYLEVYTIVAERKPAENDLASPKHFLLCHALENAMKGWLVLREEEPLQGLKRKYGHDLVKLARAADQYYPRVSQNLSLIEELNTSYWGDGTRDYEYPEGKPSFVAIKPARAVWMVVKECVEHLIIAIQEQRSNA